MLLEELRSRRDDLGKSIKEKQEMISVIAGALAEYDEELKAVLFLLGLEEKRAPSGRNVSIQVAQPTPVPGIPDPSFESVPMSEVPARKRRGRVVRRGSSPVRDSIILLLNEAKGNEMPWEELRAKLVELNGSPKNPRTFAGTIGTMVQTGELHLTGQSKVDLNRVYRLRTGVVPELN